MVWTVAFGETLPPEHRRPLRFAPVAEGFRAVVRTPVTRWVTVAQVFISGAFFIWLGNAQPVIEPPDPQRVDRYCWKNPLAVITEKPMAIRWKDAERMREAANALRLTAQDLHKLGVIDRIIKVNDDEAYRIWEEEIGFPTERLFRLGKGDNYWSMGPTGPNGPCSELHYDMAPPEGRLRTPEPVVRSGVEPDPPPPQRKPVLRTWWLWTKMSTATTPAHTGTTPTIKMVAATTTTTTTTRNGSSTRSKWTSIRNSCSIIITIVTTTTRMTIASTMAAATAAADSEVVER